MIKKRRCLAEKTDSMKYEVVSMEHWWSDSDSDCDSERAKCIASCGQRRQVVEDIVTAGLPCLRVLSYQFAIVPHSSSSTLERRTGKRSKAMLFG